METRSAGILKAVIQEFIKTGEPVSSSWLYAHHDFGIRPAQIRNELKELTEKRFLEQPYHSAGRIPSDLGYEFFAHAILSKPERSAHDSFSELIADLFRNADWDELTDTLSHKLGILGIVGDYMEEEVYKKGLNDLVMNAEWDSPSAIKEIIKDFEEVDERIGTLEAIFRKDNPIEIFVGKRSPVTKSSELSVVIGTFDHEYGGKVALLAVGPKRMDYSKVIHVFKNLQETT